MDYWCCMRLISVIRDSVDHGNASEVFAFPFDRNRSIHISIVIWESTDIEAISTLCKQDHVDDVFEVFISAW